MPEKTAPRPTQVTVAAWLVMSGSVVVVLTAFDQVAGLRSAETREAVEEFLGTPLGERLGLGVQGTLSLMRVLTMIAAACATAAAILGFQVLQRSRSARLFLTLLAAPLFLAGVVVGGFLPSIIVGSIVMLWFQPARDWLDGKTPRVVPAPPAPEPPPTTPEWPPPLPPPSTSPGQPRAYPGFGGPTGPGTGTPADAWPAIPPMYAAGPVAPARPVRPAALVWACALTWAGCAIAFMAMLASVVLVLAAPDMLIDELYRQNPELRGDGLTPATIRSTVLVAGVLVIAWSIVASVVAGFAWRGRRWGWTVLLVSASCASLLCLLAALSSPPMLVPLLVSGATVPMLLRPEVRAYLRSPG
jgi:hypothetical protein